MASIMYSYDDFENPYYVKSTNGRVKLPILSGSFENKFKQVYSKYTLVRPIQISTGYSASCIFEDADKNVYCLPPYKGSRPSKMCPTMGCEPLDHQTVKYTDKILYCPDHFIILDKLTYVLYNCIVLNVYKHIYPLVKTILYIANNRPLSSDLYKYERAASTFLSKWD